MQLNKYDLVDWVVLILKGVVCDDCPIRKECNENEKFSFICFHEDEAKELLIKKYNL